MKKPLIAILLILLLTSCQSSPQADAQTEAQSDMWRVELKSAEKAESLTATIAAVQYSGDVLETSSEYEPGDGNVFLLLELVVEKTGTGKASFSWSDAHIADKDGNKYYRHSNDTFLTNLKIPRLKGTDVTFGKEEGFACFEIPENAEGLQFVADGGDIVLKVAA